MPAEAFRFSRDNKPDADPEATQPSAQPVAITQMLAGRARNLEEQFRELDSELRRRFGDGSYSVDRSEQVLGAIQRLRWAIEKAPVENPITSPPESDH